MASSDFTGNSLRQVDETSIHPVLPKHTNGRGSDARAKGRHVGLDHAVGSVDGPEDEEDDEHVVRVPESLVVGASGLLNRGEDHAHEGNQHHVSSPARARGKVGKQPAVDSKVVLGRHLGKVVPVGNGVHPREEDNGPGRRDVEGDVLVELDDAVERSLSKERDEGSADGEEDDADIDVEDQSGRSSNDEGEAKGGSRCRQAVLETVVDAGKGKDEGMGQHENEDESVRIESVTEFLVLFLLFPPPLLHKVRLGATYTLRYPSLIIHRSNFSRAVSSCCFSCVISPESNMRVRGVHLDRSVGRS